MPLVKKILMSLLAIVMPTLALSHEFWIEPQEFQLPNDAELVADLRNGEMFKGSAQSYLPQRTRRLEFYLGDEVAQIEPRIGDRPVIDMTMNGDGLMVLVHETADSVITYREIEKFARFLQHKDAPDALSEQLAEGLPDDGIREVYSRYTKSLVALGSGAGADRKVGLKTELVALENPYTGDVSDGVDVVLYYNDAPRSDAQIEVFERAPDASVMVSFVRTDDRGRATVPVRPGHAYMLDAVAIRRPATELATERNVLWESLWANLTFFIPE
jgi:uncharacterized GH25 family protein